MNKILASAISIAVMVLVSIWIFRYNKMFKCTEETAKCFSELPEKKFGWYYFIQTASQLLVMILVANCSILILLLNRLIEYDYVTVVCIIFSAVFIFIISLYCLIEALVTATYPCTKVTIYVSTNKYLHVTTIAKLSITGSSLALLDKSSQTIPNMAVVTVGLLVLYLCHKKVDNYKKELLKCQ